MGRRGPIPKPASVKRKEGNRGKRPILETLQAVPGAPPCPDDLRGEARAEWFRITAEMADAGTLSKSDRASLHEYCTVWARKRAVERGEIEAKDTHWLSLTRSIQAYLDRFGLNAASRGRVVISEKEEKDEFEEFING